MENKEKKSCTEDAGEVQNVIFEALLLQQFSNE